MKVNNKEKRVAASGPKRLVSQISRGISAKTMVKHPITEQQ